MFPFNHNEFFIGYIHSERGRVLHQRHTGIFMKYLLNFIHMRPFFFNLARPFKIDFLTLQAGEGEG